MTPDTAADRYLHGAYHPHGQCPNGVCAEPLRKITACSCGHPLTEHYANGCGWCICKTAGTATEDADQPATAAGREPRGLRVSALAPRGALPGCPGRIVLTIDKNNCGSWSTPCSLDLSLDCEAPGCWWSRNEWDGEVDAELFGVAASMHALDAAEAPDGT